MQSLFKDLYRKQKWGNQLGTRERSCNNSKGPDEKRGENSVTDGSIPGGITPTGVSQRDKHLLHHIHALADGLGWIMGLTMNAMALVDGHQYFLC